jgi:hypothetical protein
MNKVSPGSIPKINTSGGQFKMMENINVWVCVELVSRYAAMSSEANVDRKMTACRDVGPCNLLEVYGKSSGPFFFHHDGTRPLQTVSSSYSPQWETEISPWRKPLIMRWGGRRRKLYFFMSCSNYE